ncbi:MAG TPA: flagellar biosynthesis anti-sigma factor FlgM [Spirochaetia bacterium]|nr:flagellar biosynthesis anti-sigma factor FlgM [Spirochaetia bacterium]
MTIERVGLPDPISKFNKTEKTQRPTKKQDTDSVSVSADAKMKAEIYSATETVKMSPDIRMDRVEEIKKKLQDPNYVSNKVIEDLAEKLMEFFKI